MNSLSITKINIPKGALFRKELLDMSQGNIFGRNLYPVRHWFSLLVTEGVN